MAMKNDANVPLIFVVGTVGALVLLAIIVGLEALYLYAERAEIAAKSRDAAAWRQELADQQHERLHSYGWTDPERRLASIPIERAMEKLVQSGGKLPATCPQ